MNLQQVYTLMYVIKLSLHMVLFRLKVCRTLELLELNGELFHLPL